MIKIKNIIRSIRIEEYILFVFSLILFSTYLILFPQLNCLRSFRDGFKVVATGVNYFSIVFIFIYFYISFKYVVNWLSPFIKKKDSFKNILFSLPNSFCWPKIKDFLRDILFLLRPLFSITIFFILFTLIIGSMAVQLRGQLIDGWLMEIDKSLFGFYPFLWFHESTNFLKSLTPLFLYPFLWLGLIMGISWIIFYLANQRRFLSRYIVATTLAIMIALPLWFFFPANSPQNTYLNNVYNKEIDFSIKELVKNYQPNKYLLGFHDKVGVKQGGIAPVSTMPSMHMAWALIIIYYLFRFKRKTLFFALPWFFFSSLGTVYLAQHYFIDVLVALPVAVIAISLANLLVKLEKKYYQSNRFQDKREVELKNQIKADLKRLLNILRPILKIRL